MKMVSEAKFSTVLKDKCGNCEYYTPLIAVDRRVKFEVMFCRGSCILKIEQGKSGYQQRTDKKCKKYKEKVNEI